MTTHDIDMLMIGKYKALAISMRNLVKFGLDRKKLMLNLESRSILVDRTAPVGSGRFNVKYLSHSDHEAFISLTGKIVFQY